MSNISEEIREKARVIADATGRDIDSVIEDLLDDGVVNLSNEKKDNDLITQLKEAAELITTVQNINKQVNSNTVLNGGENKTEVKVETTLEGDVVDRAIASAQRKADDIKKLILTMTPIFLLITGSGMEAFGVIDVFNSEDDDNYDPYYEEYGGCMNPDALNYDEYASWEDGSCDFDDSGGGGGPPECESDWWWQHEAIFDHDHNGQGFNNDLRIQVDFRDLNECGEHMNNGYFEIMVGEEDRILEYNFHDEFTINEHYLDLPAGDYYVTVKYYTYDGSMWNGPETWVTMESEPTCVTDLIHKEAELYLIGGNELEVAMIIQSNNDCESEVDFMFSLYHNDTYQSTVEYGVLPLFTVSGTGEYRITFSHSDWKNLGEGLWNLETRFYTESDGEVCCIMTNKVEVKVD